MGRWLMRLPTAWILLAFLVIATGIGADLFNDPLAATVTASAGPAHRGYRRTSRSRGGRGRWGPSSTLGSSCA